MPQFFVVSKSTEPRSELTDSKGTAFEYPRTGASLDETEISTIIKISKIDERSFKINVWRSLIGYGRNFGCKYSIMICKTRRYPVAGIHDFPRGRRANGRPYSLNR